MVRWYVSCEGSPEAAFKPVACPEQSFSHTRTRRLPLGGTRDAVCRGNRRALPSGNEVAQAIGCLPEERGKSAPMASLLRLSRLSRIFRLSRAGKSNGVQPAREREKALCTASASGRIFNRGPLRIPLGDSRISPVCSSDVPPSPLIVSGRTGRDFCPWTKP